MKEISVFKETDDMFTSIHQALFDQDVDSILSWFYHCLEYFPPVVYSNAPVILSRLKDNDCFIKILRELYQYCPDIVYTYAAQKATWYEGVYGAPVKVENPYDSDRVVKKKKKFNERWASSQECYQPSVEAICANYNVLLVSPSSSPASSYYRTLGEYLEIPFADLSLDAIHNMLCDYRPRVLIEMHPMDIPLSLTMNRTYTALMMGDTVVASPNAPRRMPNFAISGASTGRMVVPGNTISFSETVRHYMMPRSSDRRDYLITNDKKFNEKEIRFGAFCRLGKLDLTTLNT